MFAILTSSSSAKAQRSTTPLADGPSAGAVEANGSTAALWCHPPRKTAEEEQDEDVISASCWKEEEG